MDSWAYFQTNSHRDAPSRIPPAGNLRVWQWPKPGGFLSLKSTFFLVNSELPWTAPSVLVEYPSCVFSLNKLWLLGDISILDRRNPQLSSVLNQFLILNRSSRSYMANLRQNTKLFGWCFPIPLNSLNDPKYVISSPTSTMVSGGCLMLRRRNDRFFSKLQPTDGPDATQNMPREAGTNAELIRR